jgi:hypothetical protein
MFVRRIQPFGHQTYRLISHEIDKLNIPAFVASDAVKHFQTIPASRQRSVIFRVRGISNGS